jgi:hypothetical protein
MTETPKHTRRRLFVAPELTLFGQMDRIVMLSPPDKPARSLAGKGDIRTNRRGDFFGS